MTKDELVTLAKAKAVSHSLDPALFCALVETESGWYTHASRTEKGFKKRYIDPIKSVKRWGSTSYETERENRATSFGLCQVMGQVAREMGFEGRSLGELCIPEIGLEFGARRLAKAMDRKGGNVSEALLNYNGGADKEYAARVLDKVKNYE